ncbi:MAG: hypothetical protein ABJE95_37655 [Byssovorax sp.]
MSRIASQAPRPWISGLLGLAIFALAGCCEPHRRAGQGTLHVAVGVACPSGEDANDRFARERSESWGEIEGDATAHSLAAPIQQCCYWARVRGPVEHDTLLCYENAAPDATPPLAYPACVSPDLAPSKLGSTYGYGTADVLGGPWRGADLVVECSYDITEYEWADVCG